MIVCVCCLDGWNSSVCIVNFQFFDAAVAIVCKKSAIEETMLVHYSYQLPSKNAQLLVVVFSRLCLNCLLVDSCKYSWINDFWFSLKYDGFVSGHFAQSWLIGPNNQLSCSFSWVGLVTHPFDQRWISTASRWFHVIHALNSHHKKLSLFPIELIQPV